ncbi:ephrin-A4-like isoform X2 [Xyrauchen texanus]|uniref:ephrin-A4-like isoform X2 n=1 Tax=Xyrauchen texanus TaxID=154827 RepID=UPI0022426865|nr:ephrin-A4-like isoform X2 [Xyrauchen texanus]
MAWSTSVMNLPRCFGVCSMMRLLVLFIHVFSTTAKRHVVYWNSTNTRLTGDDYSVQVNLSDYLDILCPHYPAGQPLAGPVETLALYLVAEGQFRGCVETKEAIKRWECNQPHAPYGPVRFSEKIQRFTPFSLGFEFLPGHHYYYSSLSADDGPPLPCMKLRLTVCCPPSGSSRQEATERPSHSSAVHSATDGRISLLIALFLPFFL